MSEPQSHALHAALTAPLFMHVSEHVSQVVPPHSLPSLHAHSPQFALPSISNPSAWRTPPLIHAAFPVHASGVTHVSPDHPVSHSHLGAATPSILHVPWMPHFRASHGLIAQLTPVNPFLHVHTPFPPHDPFGPQLITKHGLSTSNTPEVPLIVDENCTTMLKSPEPIALAAADSGAGSCHKNTRSAASTFLARVSAVRVIGYVLPVCRRRMSTSLRSPVDTHRISTTSPWATVSALPSNLMSTSEIVGATPHVAPPKPVLQLHFLSMHLPAVPHSSATSLPHVPSMAGFPPATPLHFDSATTSYGTW